MYRKQGPGDGARVLGGGLILPNQDAQRAGLQELCHVAGLWFTGSGLLIDCFLYFWRLKRMLKQTP